VQLVIVPLAENVVVQRDETGVDDGRLAVETPVREFLPSVQIKAGTHVVIVQVTVCLTFPLVRADMLEMLPTLCTPEALWVETL
jgi:hypothetical protein